MFVLCLRDVTERRESEQADARERGALSTAGRSRARGHRGVRCRRWPLRRCERVRRETLWPGARAPAGGGPIYPEPTAAARRLAFGTTRARLHPAGARRRGAGVRVDALRCRFGKELICEVRLVRLPSGSRRLVRGSIADISERKRAERIAAAEREVFEQLTRNAPLAEVLARSRASSSPRRRAPSAL